MADLEIVAFDDIGKELEAPQGLGDRYLARKVMHLEEPLTTDSTMDGRSIATDGSKLDLLTVTSPVNLDTLAAAQGPGAVILMPGGWDASTGLFPVSTLYGETWICTAAGLVDGVQFEINDRVTALVDEASTSTYIGNWIKAQYADLVTSVAGKQGPVVLEEGDIIDLQSYMLAADIDSLSKLNALVVDATLTDIADQATAAQGALAATAHQDADLDSLSKLNALVLDATLIDTNDPRLSDARTPTAHEHIPTMYTVATLPVGTVGQIAQVSDGDAALAYGATVINSGAGVTPYLVWFNSNNWTVFAQ